LIRGHGHFDLILVSGIFDEMISGACKI
jgi:hypothetical protein